MLCFNLSLKQWFNVDLVAIAACIDQDDGDAYYLKEGYGIYHLLSGTLTTRSFTWRSGKLQGQDPEAYKTWQKIRLNGSGTVTVEAFLDDVSAATKTITLSNTMERDRRMKFPGQSNARELKVECSGTGTIDELIVEYEL